MSGYKTYVVAAAMIGYAILGVVLHLHTTDTAMQIIFTALGLAGLRHGITTEVNK